ncbi:MAG: hypothetical protein R6V02_10095 [Candidatus Aminicenantes bacterium]
MNHYVSFYVLHPALRQARRIPFQAPVYYTFSAWIIHPSRKLTLPGKPGRLLHYFYIPTIRNLQDFCYSVYSKGENNEHFAGIP